MTSRRTKELTRRLGESAEPMRPRTLALISVFLILSSMISLACNEPTPTPPNLALLDGETGEVIWSVRAPGGDYVGQSFPGAGLVLLEGMQVCSGEPVERLVLDGATGESIWESLKPFLGSDGVQMANWDRDKGSLTMLRAARWPRCTGRRPFPTPGPMKRAKALPPETSPGGEIW